MPRSGYDSALVAVVGLLVGAVIWTVADVAYDDPAAGRAQPGPVCPHEGIRVTAGPVNPAMGLRAMDLTLENCGTRAYRVQGYPEIRLLDRDQRHVTGVSVLHGSAGIATVGGFDEPPNAVTPAPGERASAGLLWRNTTGFGGAAHVPYLTVEARSGALPVLLSPDGGLDLGTTGRLGVGPWRSSTTTSTSTSTTGSGGGTP